MLLSRLGLEHALASALPRLDRTLHNLAPTRLGIVSPRSLLAFFSSPRIAPTSLASPWPRLRLLLASPRLPSQPHVSPRHRLGHRLASTSPSHASASSRLVISSSSPRLGLASRRPTLVSTSPRLSLASASNQHRLASASASASDGPLANPPSLRLASESPTLQLASPSFHQASVLPPSPVGHGLASASPRPRLASDVSRNQPRLLSASPLLVTT